MKICTIGTLLILALLTFSGCQKSPETQMQTVEPSKVAEIPTANPSAEEMPVQAAAPADSAPTVNHELKNSSFLDKFNQYKLSPEIITPEFATDLLTKNGDFARTMKGQFVYFDINQATSQAEFNQYIQKLFAHVQSNAQDNKIYSFDINTQTHGDAISAVESSAENSPVQFAWQSEGKWYGLYVNIKEYAPGSFTDINDPHKALYLTVVELPE